MHEAKHIIGPTPYASRGDFCRIFYEEIDNLYRLSFLLTADADKAERCFVSGLEDSLKGNRVFKEWARSWARRAIIQNAVRVVNPQSFHWTMELSVPWPRLALLCVAVLIAGTATGWLAARGVSARQAALAVKEDW